MRFILDEAVGEQERDRYESGKKGELSFGWWKIYFYIAAAAAGGGKGEKR